MLPFSLDNFKMGYFIQYRGGTGKFGRNIVNKQLKEGFSKEDAQYSHTEVSGGGKHSINTSPPLSTLVDITQKHKGRYIRIVRFKNAIYEKKGRYKVAYFSATLNNTGYDIKGVLGFAFKWIKHDNRLYFCSEGCAWALQKEFSDAGEGRAPEKWMPAHFSPGKEFELIWEGYIPK